MSATAQDLEGLLDAEEDASLDKTMAETLRKLESGEDDENNGTKPDAETEGSEEEGQEADDLEQDEAAGEGEDETDAETDAEKEETETTDPDGDTDAGGGEPDETESDPKLARPPSTWNAEGKSKWKELPEWAKKQVLKRESDAANGISQYKQKADFADELNQVITPYKPLIDAAGSTPAKTIQSLLNTVYQLKTATPQQKAQLLLQTAKQYGADMSVFGKAEEKPDEFQNKIQQVIHPLTEKITSLENTYQTQQQQSEQARQAETVQQIQAFRDAANEDGSPKYLYFDDVREDMADLIQAAAQSGKSLSLEQAYDKTVWANDDIRALIQAEQQKSEDDKRQKQAKARAVKAKKADKVNIGKKTGKHAEKQPKPLGSIDETIRETYDNITSRET